MKFAVTRPFTVALVLAVLPPADCAAAVTTAHDPLLSLASDVWAQFDLAYRSQPVEHRRRQTQFNAVIEAWRAAPASAVSDTLLANWMRTAIQASMPGSRTPLPPAPQFVRPAQQAGLDLLKTQYSEPATGRLRVAGPVAAAGADPFQDDPLPGEHANSETSHHE